MHFHLRFYVLLVSGVLPATILVEKNHFLKQFKLYKIFSINEKFQPKFSKLK